VETKARTADLVVAACAISAGAHAALVPSHLDHEPQIGVAFIVAVVLLLGAGAALVHSPSSARAAQAAALLFAGLIASYAAATTVGIPLLSLEPEAIDGMALVTKFVESLGLLLALTLTNPWGTTGRSHARRYRIEQKRPRRSPPHDGARRTPRAREHGGGPRHRRD
jgi:hypothetical protein